MEPRRLSVLVFSTVVILISGACSHSTNGSGVDQPPAIDSATGQESLEPPHTTVSESASGDSAPHDPAPIESDASSAMPDDGESGSAEDGGEFETPPLRGDNSSVHAVKKEPILLKDIRFGRHEGYERVVFELSGSGPLDFSAEYVSQALADGSGLPVEVAGDAILQIRVSGVSTPVAENSGQEQDFLHDPYEPPFDSEIEMVIPMPPFEGHAQYLIGLDEQVPVRMALLSDPTRLVVDCKTDSSSAQ